MSENHSTPKEPIVFPLVGHHPAWLVVLLALLGWQGWLTLALFSPERDWRALVDDRPILSGRHPLHLYHGFLGSRTLRERGTLSCFDPAFHAGYPKTPVFDGGSRPAELALALAGGEFKPSAYKISLAVVWVLVPLLLYGSARGTGLPRGPACLVCFLGLLLWWGQPCRTALEAGDSDLLLASIMAVAQAGFLTCYHRDPGPGCLFLVVLTGSIGWFAHPALLASLLPVFLIYYVSTGTRHTISWHLPLLVGLFFSVAANAFWLYDWAHYWWIRVPLTIDGPLLAHRTFRALWETPLWGGPVDRILACCLLGAALAGVILFNETSQRATARLFGLAFAGFLVLAVFGVLWEGLGRLGTAQLLIPGLLFATLPAGHALASLLGKVRCLLRTSFVPLFLVIGLAVLAWLIFPSTVQPWVRQLHQPTALEIGLGSQQTQLVEAVRTYTNDEARILWEDQRRGRLASRWPALLPLLTGRSFVGGLDPEAGIEHTTEGLVDQVLSGRALGEWTDADLEDYCQRYNIGWVMCWSPQAQARFRHWKQAQPMVLLPGGEQVGCLFRLTRKPSFALTGSVTLQAADSRHILLADAVPMPAPVGSDEKDNEGQIVLSLHYQTGMRVTPGRVRLEKAVGAEDAIPFVRLRMKEPVGRIMITWENR